MIRSARATTLATTLLAATIGTGVALAQQRPDFSAVQIKTTRLGEDFYTLEGQGGTISVLTGPDGVLIVDAQFAPLTDKLVTAIRAVSDRPVRFLVNTHVHGDHTGGNENFARLGATIFSRDQLRERLAHPNPAPDGTPGKPAPALALPVVTYDAPVTIHLDGEDVRLLPMRSAHTDGDTLVQFPAHDILAVGDFFRTVGYPFVDLNNGGSLTGLLDAFDAAIALAGPRTRVIPGHGAISDRAGLAAQRALIVGVRNAVAAQIAQGKTLEETIAAHPTAAFDAQVVQNGQGPERFITWVYTEVKKGH